MLTSTDFPHCGDSLGDSAGWEHNAEFSVAVQKGVGKEVPLGPFFSEQPHLTVCSFPIRAGLSPSEVLGSLNWQTFTEGPVEPQVGRSWPVFSCVAFPAVQIELRASQSGFTIT